MNYKNPLLVRGFVFASGVKGWSRLKYRKVVPIEVLGNCKIQLTARAPQGYTARLVGQLRRPVTTGIRTAAINYLTVCLLISGE